MRIDGLTHPKTKELALTLQVPLAHAIGLLELLWAFVGQQTPEGNVGKWSNGVIATEAGWHGDADLFVDALVQVRFLDESQTYRLLVHDWSEHCPNWVRAKLKKQGRTILSADLSSDLSGVYHSDYKGREGKGSVKHTSESADAPSDLPPRVTFEREHFHVAEHIANALSMAGVTKLPADLSKWANSVRLACERDKRTPDELIDVFDWAHNDEFWRANILSPDKLRKKFDTLMMQRQRAGQATTRSKSISDELTDTSWAN